MSMNDEHVSRCPRCGGFVIIRLGGVSCMSCEWEEKTKATEIKETRTDGETKICQNPN